MYLVQSHLSRMPALDLATMLSGHLGGTLSAPAVNNVGDGEIRCMFYVYGDNYGGNNRKLES